MDIFSNREIATAIWAVLAIIWLSRKPAVVESFKQVLSAFLNKYLLTLIIVMLMYISAMVYALHEIGLWELNHLKNTIIWTIPWAAVTLFRSQQATDNPYYFSTAIKDNIKLIIIFEFIITFYSFNILVELITVPILALLVMVQAYSETKKEYAVVVKATETIFSIYFVILLIFTVYRITIDVTEFAKTDTLIALILPPLMSILFLPFMYPVVIYLAYERAFMRMRSSLSEELMRYAKFWSIIHFHADRILLSRWGTIISRLDINTKKELLESIHKVKKMKLAEERCEDVNFEDGWSPHKAKHYLSSVGITTDYYHPLYDDLWFASSPYLTLENESPVLSNNICYYIEGAEKHAKSLKLVLDVNNPENADEAHKVFVEYCNTLTSAALCTGLPLKFANAIIKEENTEQLLNNRLVSIERHDWVGSTTGCYELKFKICLHSYGVLSGEE